MVGEWCETMYGKSATRFVEDRLQNLCDPDAGIQTGPFGSQLHQEDYVSVGTPIITVEHLGENRILHEGAPRVSDADRNRLSRYLLRSGDIVFSRVGSVDRRALVRRSEDGWMFSGRCLRVRPNPKKIDSEFLAYFFGLPAFKEHIRAIAVGATMPSLNTSLLSDVIIRYPQNIIEQKAIAHILGTLDDKIELNRRMNVTLEAMARALFQSWFVDFDPVRAKIDGRKPVGLDEETAALFPDRFQDSELGRIPEGWGVGAVGEAFNLTMGQSPPGATYNEEGNGIPFYQGRRDFGFRFPTCRVYCTAPTRFGKPKDTLVSVRAPVGDINMADEECCIGRGVAAVRHKSGASSYTYYAMTNLTPNFACFEGEGTVFGSINRENFETLPVMIVPPAIIVAYEQLAKPLDEQICTFEHQSRILATLRDALLPKLMSGELMVADIDGIIGVCA